MADRDLIQAEETLRYTLGATCFAAGLDKFFNLLTDWEKYLNPKYPELLGISGKQLMYGVGVVEMIVGAGILKGFKRSGGYIASAWLLSIAQHLVTQGRYLDVAARDVNMAAEAFALAKLAAHRSALEGGSSQGLEAHEPATLPRDFELPKAA